MTAVASLYHSTMDLLRADDQMDVTSSPAVNTDVDFELDDVRDVSAEPNQDLMLPDEPEQPAVESDLMRPSTSNHGDDDLMLDEDSIAVLEDQTDIPELSMDGHQDARIAVDEDEDILYEDEDDLQEQSGRAERLSEVEEMEDEVEAEDLQLNQQVELSDPFQDEAQTTVEIDGPAEEAPQGTQETSSIPEQLQTTSAEAAVGPNHDSNASTKPGSDAKSEQDLALRYPEDTTGEDTTGNVIRDRDTNEEPNRADIETPRNKPEQDANATGAHESNPSDMGASDNVFQPETLESDPYPDHQADVNSADGDTLDEPALQTPLLHSVKVHYLETEMCLFPPTEDDDSEMFFLQDVNLAHVGLDKMLGACRDVLANTIGQDDELVLDFASLGLHISEGSRYASQITLSQIIDVYVALAHNDNLPDLGPLYCSLTSRVCLASQYAYLQSSANEGKTLTQILEENDFASGEDGADGEDRFQDQQAVTPQQEVSTDSKDTDEVIGAEGSEHVPPTLEREPQSESTNSQTTSRMEGDNCNPEGLSFEGDNDELNAGGYGDWKELQVEHGEQSATSTVKGDPNEFEDDVPPISDKHDNKKSTDDILVTDVETRVEYGPTESNPAESATDLGKPDIASSIQESVSSRTLEAETNQPEEDIFSQGNNQTFENARNNLTETQLDDDDEFGLEAQSQDDASLDVDNRHSDKLDYGTDDLAVEYAALGSPDDLSNNADTPDQDDEKNPDSTYVRNYDDNLNFVDEEERTKEEHRQALHQSDEHEVSGSTDIDIDSALNSSIKVRDMTEAYHEGPRHAGYDSSSKLVTVSGNQTPLTHSVDNTLRGPTEAAPTTPSGGQNGAKRKAVEDEDEFDLFDTLTPDKKRGRSS